MKKIILIMLISFSTLVFAHTGRYMIHTSHTKGYSVWILDTETGQVKLCHSYSKYQPRCTKWSSDDLLARD